jgi:hypothetical protein
MLAVAILACGALASTARAEEATVQPTTEVMPEIVFETFGFEPFASDHIRSWAPLLSRTSYGAQVTFTGTFSGTIRVELQNSSGSVQAFFTESFTNRNSIAYTRNRNTPSGTYRIVIRVTINNTTTVRTSHLITI